MEAIFARAVLRRPESAASDIAQRRIQSFEESPERLLADVRHRASDNGPGGAYSHVLPTCIEPVLVMRPLPRATLYACTVKTGTGSEFAATGGPPPEHV